MLICLSGIAYTKVPPKDRRSRYLIVAFLLFYACIALSFFNSTDQQEAIRKLFLKTPILLFPLVFLTARQLSERGMLKLGIVINYALYLPAVVSVYNYFINKELFDDLILQSKPLPIEFGYHLLHINFSILMACGVLFGIFQLYQSFRTRQLSFPFYMLLILVLLNFVFIHILSTRTGLVGLYAGLAVFCLYLISSLPFKKSGWILLAVILVPVILISVSTSLQNRIRNTVIDLKVVLENRNANDYSFAMRYKAWLNAVDVIKENRLAGVGIGDAEDILVNNFVTFDPAIDPENRKNPHFQFLETAVQSGLVCASLYLVIFILGFLRTGNKFNFQLIAFLSLLYVASCFESVLESQVSVIAYVFFIALLADKKEVGEENS